MNAIPEGYLENARGHLVPKETIKAQDLLQDQTVRKIVSYADDLAARIGRFKGHTYEDVFTFLDLLREKYGITKRGTKGKGNLTLTSFDGNQQVTIRVHDQLAFGPELKIAEEVISACLRKWGSADHPVVRSLVMDAFNADKEGNLSREKVFQVMNANYESVEEPEWHSAIELLRQSIRVVGSKSYLGIAKRTGPEGVMRSVKIDLASAEIPEGMVALSDPAEETADD